MSASGGRSVVAGDPSQAVAPPVARRHAWLMLGAAYLAGVVAAAGQYKLPPLVPLTMSDLGADLTSMSTLMTVFGLAGVAFALPAGWIQIRLGPRRAGMVAMGLIAIGSAIGAVGASYPALVIDQVLEGAGIVLVAVVAPSVIANVFPADEAGVPMGIWATWAPVGGLMMFIVAPWLAEAGGWQVAWWYTTAAAVLAGIVFGATMRLAPPDGRVTPRADRRIPTAPDPVRDSVPFGPATDRCPADSRSHIASRSLWLLALSFGCFCLASTALTGFYPTFLVTERGTDLATASAITSLSMLALLVTAPVSGAISDRLGSRRIVYTVPILLTVPLWVIAFMVAGWQVVVLMVLFGALWSASPSAVFAAVPEVVKGPSGVAIGMAALMLGQNLGYALGPLLFAPIAEGAGWTAAGWAMVPVTIVGVVAGWLVRVR